MEPHHEAASQADPDGVSPDIGALCEEHKDAMYGMARSMLRNEDQHHAKDVVQDVVVSLLPELPTGIRNWEGFLIHAVKMKIYDLWKSAAHKHEKLVLEGVRPLEEERTVATISDWIRLSWSRILTSAPRPWRQFVLLWQSWTGANRRRRTCTGRSRSLDGRPKPWPTKPI